MISSPYDKDISEFRHSIKNEFNQYLLKEANKYDLSECLKIDFHCHDHNSDVPDELWGRILGLPETWLKTKKLVQNLRKNGCDVITITNHNNARSCWDLIERGEDVLVGTEFTCLFPEYELYVHVLTYGFSREQEKVLNKKRQNIYDFLRYTTANDIPVILPHPLYFYTRNEHIDFELFEKLVVMFQRFEVLNGQRDLWQSVLTLNWVKSLTPEKINSYAAKHDLDPEEFGVDPFKPKILTGGSDDHMGMFAGNCGSYLWVPNLKRRIKTEKVSDLALEALREGHIVPFGQVVENQKLTIALLDYFAQIATNMEDPGLLRMMLHRGEISDKLGCFAIANIMMEMRKHKNTKKFFGFVHDALGGKKPNKLLKWKIPKDYKFFIKHLEKIAESKHQSTDIYIETVNASITELFTELNQLIIRRINNLKFLSEGVDLADLTTEELTRRFEIPAHIRALIAGNTKQKNMSHLSLESIVDELYFPLMICLIFAGSTLMSARALYQNREFLNKFARDHGKNRHPTRALYLTDTLKDKNGVSNSLTAKLREIQAADIAVDFLICHEDTEPESHLHVVRPLTSFHVIGYGEQVIRIPDLMEIARIFYQGGYDRVICSTEGPMALVSLFVKYMFNVPSYFFMHTDWVDFVKHTTNLNHHERDRIRRSLRMLYQQYDGVFVLNTQHREWLISKNMDIEEEKVFLTAHHSQQRNESIEPFNKQEFFDDATDKTPILFIACRVSKEKGILELPEIIDSARQSLADLRIVVAGTGPAEDELKEALPEAKFLGWSDKVTLARCYLGLDLFIFPSKFDTFGNVILESFAHGMPVLAYNCKGPKDIIEHGRNGYLVESKEEMSQAIVGHFTASHRHESMSQEAVSRANEYQAETIMAKFIDEMGLPVPEHYIQQKTVV